MSWGLSRLKTAVFPVRSSRAADERLRFALNQQNIVLRPLRCAPYVLDLAFIVVAQLIKAKTVVGRVDERGEPGFEHCLLRRIKKALKDRVLHTLAIVDAGFCHFSQPPAAGRAFGVHIVCHQYQHKRLTSRKTADNARGPRAGSSPKSAPVHMERGPRAAFRRGTDALWPPDAASARRSGTPAALHR